MKKTNNDLQQLKDKTFIITVTLPVSDITAEYQHMLSHAAADVEVKGFRKGKAPLDVVESHVDPHKIMEQVANNLLSKIYSDKIKEFNLKPIIQPQVKILNPPITLKNDWQVEITGCEMPLITLDKLEEKIKKIKIDTTKIAEKDQKEAKLNQIFDVLLASAKVDLPPVLIEADVQNRLSQLVEQTAQAGITVENFLKSKNTTIEQYTQSIKDQITKEWTLNLAIDKIATDQKIEVSQNEIDSLVSKNPSAATNVNMLVYVLRQQKVIDYLEKLN